MHLLYLPRNSGPHSKQRRPKKRERPKRGMDICGVFVPVCMGFSLVRYLLAS